MKKSRGFSYPMPLEDAEELAREPSEFGYRERPTTPTRPADAVTTRSRSGPGTVGSIARCMPSR
jgi:hypothetical protein